MTDPADTLAPLVAVHTSHAGGDEPALARLLHEALQTHAPDRLELRQVPRPGSGDAAWVFAAWGAPRVLVNVHLDTVPAAPGWTGSPFELRREGERLVGLGAADTKGAIAAVLAALESVRPRDVAVLFSGDEERGNRGVRDFLASGLAEGLERAVVCEPTGLGVGTRHRGIVALELRRRGPGGHSSRADQLPAPVAELARTATALDDWGRARRGLGPPGFAGLCLNLARLEGGVAFNVIPPEATLTVSFRPPPGADVRRLREEAVAVILRAPPAPGGAAVGDTEVEVVLENPSFQTREPLAFLPLLGERVRRPLDLGFWTEAALFAEAGIDAVVFGPGRIEQAHAADEWVSHRELLEAREVFAAVLSGGGEGNGPG